jgi:hypothetical protein
MTHTEASAALPLEMDLANEEIKLEDGSDDDDRTVVMEQDSAVSHYTTLLHHTE